AAPGRGGRGRLPARPPGTGTARQRRLLRGQRRRRPTTGAAGDPPGSPRVLGRPVGGVLGGGTHCELVHIGFPEDRDTGGTQPGGQGGVIGRHPALEDLRPAGGGHIGRGEHVLECQRHTGQRRG